MIKGFVEERSEEGLSAVDEGADEDPTTGQESGQTENDGCALKKVIMRKGLIELDDEEGEDVEKAEDDGDEVCGDDGDQTCPTPL